MIQMNTTPIKRNNQNNRLNFTPKKPKNGDDERNLFPEYENELKQSQFEGRGCYVVQGFYMINDQKIPFVKCGFTDSLFSFKCPIQKKIIRGRIYTIIQDLRKMNDVSYAKIDSILAFYKETAQSPIPIKCFETELLKRTRKFKIDVGSKKEYRNYSNKGEILSIASDLQKECSEYVYSF